MTEHEWLTGSDSRPMVQLLAGSARGTDRTWRLFMVAFWIGQLPFIRTDAQKTEFIERVGLLEEWADTGSVPPHDYTNVFLSPDRATALRRTIEVAGQSEPNWSTAYQRQADAIREVFGNPFRPVALDPMWLTSDVLALARGIYDEKAFDRMPILADALQDAGCNNDDILNHCRDVKQVHVRGCWVCDLVLGKQ